MNSIKLGLIAVALLGTISAFATKANNAVNAKDDVTCQDGSPIPSGCTQSGNQLCCVGTDGNPYLRFENK